MDNKKVKDKNGNLKPGPRIDNDQLGENTYEEFKDHAKKNPKK